VVSSLFSDYMKPAIRLSAMDEVTCYIHLYTWIRLWVGEGWTNASTD